MTIEKVYCNKCGGQRNHVLKAEHKSEGSELIDDQFTIEWEDRYETLECGGCGEVAFRHKQYFSEWVFPPEESGWVETFYPPRLSRPLPVWMDDLDEDLKSVLTQTYEALHGGMFTLATFGSRTALDIVITSLVGDVGAFEAKLKKMVDDQHITEPERKLFEAVVEAGSAAAHRGFQPNVQLLGKVIDILEAVIARKIVYPRQMPELVANADKILSSVPKRVKARELGARPAVAPPPDAGKNEGGV